MGPRRNAADSLCECLSRLGVEVVFGVPGTQSLTLYESLRQARFRSVTACSEAGALWMANGYYRATGRPGVAVTIGGPGFALGLPGLAEARNDSAALVHVVCTSDRKSGKAYPLQDLDLAAVSSAVAKTFRRISSAETLWKEVADAFHESLDGEPGPVVIEFPASVAKAEAAPRGPAEESPRAPAVAASSDALNRIVRKLADSRRPVFLIGQGAADVSGDVVRLAESLNAAVVTNCSGHGIVPDSHRMLVCSDFSGWGADLVNELFEAGDCIAVLGCKLSHNGSSGYELVIPAERSIRIDTSQEALDSNYRVGIALRGDLRALVPAILDRVRGPSRDADRWTEREISAWKNRFAERRRESVPNLTRPCAPGVPDVSGFFERLGAVLGHDAIVVTDCGMHQLLVRRSMPVNRARGFIAPSDFQSVGFGIPAAIGARLGAPSRPVVAIVGDGGLAVTGFELLTAVREGLDLTVIVFCDGYLGQIRTEQLKRYGVDFGTALGTMDIEKFAGSLGARYAEIRDEISVELGAALRGNGVCVLGLPMKDTPQLRAAVIERSVKNRVRHFPGMRKLRRIARRARERFSSG